MEAVLNSIRSGEFRDDPTPETVAQAASTLTASWTQPSDASVNAANEALAKLLAFPETKSMSLGGPKLAQLALARASVADMAIEANVLTMCILNVYVSNPASRVELRRTLGSCLVPTSSVTLINVCLRVIRSILASGAYNETNVCKSLLLQRLLPLHQATGKISPTESLLGQFHRELCLCVGEAVHSSPELLEAALLGLLDKYPGLTEGNSPKEVLFLHEIEFLLNRAADKTTLALKTRQACVNRLASCAGSLHALVAERALTFWQNPQVVTKLQGPENLVDKTCTQILARTSMDHWSSTVKSMAGAALLLSTGSSPGATSKTNNSAAHDPLVQSAIHAAQHMPTTQSTPIEPAPLPKSFSSTTVIRDATEPFAMGSFGCLWRGRATVPGKPRSQWPLLALKEMTDKELAQREVLLMSHIGPNPNLIGLLGVFEAKTTCSLVLELAEGGDLHSAVCDRGSLSLDTARFLGGEIGEGLRFVHSKGFVFGDVKPENVVLTSSGHAKLCDFGSCFTMNGQEQRVLKGTVEYMAPEQVSSAPGDWWAFGCVVHFMLTGRPPVFFSSDDSDLSLAFQRAVTFAEEQGGGLLKDEGAKQLVACLTRRDPKQRPTDGGESVAFFQPVRPWRDLHLKQAPVLSVGMTPREKGPWTRRTFSVMHAPMPTLYTMENAVIEVKGTEGQGAPWDGMSGNLPFLDAIPKKRVADPALQATRRAWKGASSYQVLGIDLSAG